MIYTCNDLIITSLAFEKSLESQPLDFYPCVMYSSIGVGLSFFRRNHKLIICIFGIGRSRGEEVLITKTISSHFRKKKLPK